MNTNFIKEFRFYAFAGFGFGIPIHFEVAKIFLILYIGAWFLEGNYKERIKAFNLNTNRYNLLALVGLFFLYVIGLLWTDNMDEGLFGIEKRLSFLLVPLLVGTEKDWLSNADRHRKLCNAFLLGLVSIIFIDFGTGIIHYVGDGSLKHFVRTDLTSLGHPSYQGMLAAMGIGIVLHRLIFRREDIFTSEPILVGAMLLYFLYLFLAASRGAMLSLFILLSFYLVYILFYRKNYIAALKYVFIALLILIPSFLYIGIAKDRTKMTFEFIQKELNNSEGKSAARISIWKLGLEAFKEKSTIGYGTGDVKDILKNKYSKYKYTSYYNNQLNAHNQYLQIGLELGLIGLLLFIFFLGFQFHTSIQTRNIYFFIMLLLITINLFFESMFERAVGIMMFAFFISIFNLNKGDA